MKGLLGCHSNFHDALQAVGLRPARPLMELRSALHSFEEPPSEAESPGEEKSPGEAPLGKANLGGNVPDAELPRTLWIMVLGSTASDKTEMEFASAVGAALANAGYGLQIGGRPGKAVGDTQRAARDAYRHASGTHVRAYLPAEGSSLTQELNSDQILRWPQEQPQVPLVAADAIVVIGGHDGTRQTVQLAVKLGKRVFVLASSGPTARELFSSIHKASAEKGLAASDPQEATSHLMEALARSFGPEQNLVGKFASDDPEGDDLLGMTREARALALVLAARDVKGPLSAGVFGPWGSGKSFFMNAVWKELEDLQERLNRERAQQADIQNKLQKKPPLEGKVRESLETQLASFQNPKFMGRLVEVRFNAWQYMETDIWSSLAHQVFRRLSQIETNANESSLKEFAQKLKTGARARREQAEKLLKEKYGAGIWFQIRAFLSQLKNKPVATLCATLGVAVMTYSETIAKTINLPPWVVSLLATLGFFFPSVLSIVSEVAAATESLEGFREASRDLKEAQSLENAAQELLVQAESGKAGTLPFRYLQSYSADTATQNYESKLGNLAVIRRDFEHLSKLAPADLRVIVFIDDLDRCPPGKVVDVLQAIHLLFSFRLFAVVVAVDSRWIAQSLQNHFQGLLDTDVKEVASPFDYLEKIIQIPFWIQPMDSQSTKNLLGSLFGTPESEASPTGNADDTAHKKDKEQNTKTEMGTSGQKGERNADLPTTPDMPKPPAPTLLSLQLGRAERDYIDELADLLSTRPPRALKRFANVYQFLKASLSPAERGRWLDGENPRFRAVLFLLAVSTSLPLISTQLFALLEDDSNSNGESTAVFVHKRLSSPPQEIAQTLAPRWKEEFESLSRCLQKVQPSLASLAGEVLFVARFTYRVDPW